MKVSKTVNGFLLSKNAEGMSERTLTLYRQQLTRFAQHIDKELEAVTAQEIRKHLVYLRDEHLTPQGKRTARKTLYNNWIALRSFFRWCYAERLLTSNPASEVPAPRFKSPPPDPLSEKEVKALLKACGGKSSWDNPKDRNRAILLVLLDTGMRATELITRRAEHLNLGKGQLLTQGKGGSVRFVYLGKITRKALWRYMLEREDMDNPVSPLFATFQGRPLALSTLGDVLKTLGQRAGVPNVHLHRFRHTFAINYLRNGGDVFTLQRLLGHSSLDMVKRYVKLAEVDAELAHRRASPADNWRL